MPLIIRLIIPIIHLIIPNYFLHILNKCASS